jgi:hypothetical protein
MYCTWCTCTGPITDSLNPDPKRSKCYGGVLSGVSSKYIKTFLDRIVLDEIISPADNRITCQKNNADC